MNMINELGELVPATKIMVSPPILGKCGECNHKTLTTTEHLEIDRWGIDVYTDSKCSVCGWWATFMCEYSEAIYPEMNAEFGNAKKDDGWNLPDEVIVHQDNQMGLF